MNPVKDHGSKMRVDKWLWTVRQYKTRSLATEACDKGRIIIGDISVKASRLVGEGDEIFIKRTGLTRRLKILKLSQNRLNAKLVEEYVADLTPKEEIDSYRARLTKVTIYRDPGSGRPTKRDRRVLDDFFDNSDDE
jgi:ribosome-associated heat shock protein Hsp15